MRYLRHAYPLLRTFAAFAIVVLAAGVVLWQFAQTTSFLGRIVGPVGSAVGFGMVFVVALVVAAGLGRRELSGPIHGLVDYVKNQHDDSSAAPPGTLLRRPDEVGLLAREIRSLLETLNQQRDVLRRQTLNDPLTGLGNRRLLEQSLDIALPMSRRSMKPLSALMIDVDHFKNYNDHYGHPAGDACLLEIANVLRDTFRRETDLLIRLGGEEFLVVLLDVDAEESLRMAESMRGMLQLIAIPHEKSSVADVVTVSIGVATVEPGTQIDIAALIACADAALYECKARGRNCSISSLVDANTLAPERRKEPVTERPASMAGTDRRHVG